MEASFQVHVKLFGHLRQASPSANLVIEIPAGSTVNDLVQALASQLGDDFRKALLDPGGRLHGGIEIVLNGVHLPARKIANIPIPGACEVILIPMIEGG